MTIELCLGGKRPSGGSLSGKMKLDALSFRVRVASRAGRGCV
mgnify:CR=1 FL=1